MIGVNLELLLRLFYLIVTGNARRSPALNSLLEGFYDTIILSIHIERISSLKVIFD